MQKWPKYYESQIIVPNPKAQIGIICGWTKRHEIESLITKENLERTVAIGQLYSKEGINYLIRNFYLNKNITKLIICGKDLSGSLKFFKEFLNNDIQDLKKIIHPEIPTKNIDEFRKFFKKNSVILDNVADINKEILQTKKLSASWTDNEIDFPEAEIRETNDFPSEKISFRLEDKKICDLWLKVLDRVIKFGQTKMSKYSEQQRELINLTTVISDEDPDDPYIPEYMYFNKKDLKEYLPQMTTSKTYEGVQYTYGSRLFDFKGINQIDNIIERLKKNMQSRRAIAFTWDVVDDINAKSAPCLDLVNAIVQDNKLFLTCYIRSNDMYRAWPQNAFGLRQIQKIIADGVGIKMGKLCIVSNSAHIYERDFLKAAEVVEQHKPKIECLHDPRGNFQIEVKDKKILVKHFSPEGQVLQEFEGQGATEIMDQIYTFISDVSHALDVGRELAKAELALVNKLDYNQDNDLKL